MEGHNFTNSFDHQHLINKYIVIKGEFQRLLFCYVKISLLINIQPMSKDIFGECVVEALSRSLTKGEVN